MVDVRCHVCDYGWWYAGDLSRATCPNCKSTVKVNDVDKASKPTIEDNHSDIISHFTSKLTSMITNKAPPKQKRPRKLSVKRLQDECEKGIHMFLDYPTLQCKECRVCGKCERL